MTNFRMIAVGALAVGLGFGAQAFADAAVNAALDACRDSDEYSSPAQRSQCSMHVLAMESSVDAAAKGEDRTLHLDFDTSNDTPEVTAAKKTLDEEVNNCADQAKGGGDIEACRLEAFNKYHEALGN